MRGAYYQYLRMNGVGRYTDAVEAVNNKRKADSVARLALKKEEAELRRARIMNDAEPAYQNGHPKDAEKGRSRRKPPVISPPSAD